MRKRFFIIFFGLAASLLFFPFSSEALTVGPPKLEYSVDPGDIVEGRIFLLNEGDEEKTFYPYFEKFIEVDGEKKFLPSEPTTLADWFEAEESVTLKAKEQRYVPFKFKVPSDASPGGHFAVIWWSSAPTGSSNGQTSIVVRAGILVLLRVSGDIREEAKILSFSAEGRLLNKLPSGFNVEFQNDGNVYVKPSGEITIKNIFGKTRAVVAFNPKGMQVLPQSKKAFEESWAGGFGFGFYTANINAVYGEAANKISEKFSFFVFPWKIILGVLLAGFILVWGAKKGVKKYNQWIISKYVPKVAVEPVVELEPVALKSSVKEIKAVKKRVSKKRGK